MPSSRAGGGLPRRWGSTAPGTRVERRQVGSEGFIGLTAWLGTGISVARVVQQVGGDVVRIDAGEFRHCVESSRASTALLRSCTPHTRFSSRIGRLPGARFTRLSSVHVAGCSTSPIVLAPSRSTCARRCSRKCSGSSVSPSAGSPPPCNAGLIAYRRMRLRERRSLRDRACDRCRVLRKVREARMAGSSGATSGSPDA